MRNDGSGRGRARVKPTLRDLYIYRVQVTVSVIEQLVVEALDVQAETDYDVIGRGSGGSTQNVWAAG